MHDLWLYAWVTRFGRLNYRAKIMLAAFIGTHIPLLGLVSYFALRTAVNWHVFFATVGVTLAATLIGTCITLFVLDHLLRPVVLTSRTLRGYRQHRDLGALPTIYTDEVGTLMADAAMTLSHLETVLDTLENVDASTGLPNRRKLVADLQARLGDQTRQFVCAIRFANYGRVLESVDLQAAETAAQELAGRLRARLREEGTLYRVTTADFMVVSGAGRATAAASEFGAHLKSNLAACIEGIVFPTLAIEPQLHAGVCVSPDDASAPDALIDNALAAVALASDELPIRFHSPQARRAALERLQLEQELRRALTQDEFVLHYQPVIDLSLGRAVGAEALIRWRHPQRGLLAPVAFIGVAERSGLIDPIGFWVMREACRQVKDWNAAGFEGMKVAINLSARQFLDPNIVDSVAEALIASGISPGQLEIELTETAAMVDFSYTRAVFAKLRDLGVSIAIDDFGTGYASMSSLRKLPFDKLKIDREFVTDVHKTRDSQAICGALVALAKGLGLKVLAEGTESEDEVAYLRERGCTLYQGYYFSRPLPADTFGRELGQISLAAMAMAMRTTAGSEGRAIAWAG